ncbi:MAG: ABC-F family ATP-binding cassette domain-containing protein [Verrucomicrobiales bacterium]|nr:ABC-F family ATP-binding cassette domain-containing protein [Verrucomicrobiales bacterium]
MAAPSSTPALLSATELRLQFGLQVVLDEATMALHEGEKVGLVGRNGGGKSSLMRILSGVEQADAGTVSRRQRLRIGYLPQEPELEEAASVADNVRAGAADLLEMIHRYESGAVSGDQEAALLHQIQVLDGWNLDSRLDTLHSQLGLPDRERAVADLSGGEKRRVALARTLASQPEVLLLDEPTNHLDAESILWLEDFLRASSSAVLFVTHDRYFLDRLATRILEVDGGKIFSHPGNYTAYLEAKAVRQSIAGNHERRRQAFLRKELEFVRAGVKAQRSKARTRLDTFAEVAAQDAPEDDVAVDLIIPPPPPLANVVVDAEGLGARLDDGRWLFAGLDLSFEAGSCTGIIGRNGLGKTTLLRLLMGLREPDEGRVVIGKKTVFNYADQQRLTLDPENSVMAEVAGDSDFVPFGAEKLHVRTYLKRFLFADERVGMRVKELSGGEKSRVLLAKILCRGGNFLVLDEPTNDLDLQTLRVLEEAILAFEGTVLVVSHDRYFLDRVCDRLIAFEGEGRVALCAGNFSYYQEKRAPAAAAELLAMQAPKAAPKPARPRTEKPRKITMKERRELEAAVIEIGRLEGEIQDVEARLNDPAWYVEHAAEAPAEVERLEQLRGDLDQHMERWAELEALRETSEA